MHTRMARSAAARHARPRWVWTSGEEQAVPAGQNNPLYNANAVMSLCLLELVEEGEGREGNSESEGWGGVGWEHA